MKKVLLILIFILTFLVSTCSDVFAKEVEKFYLVKNAKPNAIKNIVDFYSRQNGYYVTSRDNTHSIVGISSDESFLVIYEPAGNNCRLYFYSTAADEDIFKDIQKRLKVNDYKYSKDRSKEALEQLRNFAAAIKSSYEVQQGGKGITYDFSDEAQSKYDATPRHSSTGIVPPSIQREEKKTAESKEDTLIPGMKQLSASYNTYNPSTLLPVGITFQVALQSAISSASIEKNDRISATLNENIIYNGKIIAEKGSVVYGTAVNAKKAGMAYGSSNIELVFDSMLTTDGQNLSFKAAKITFSNKEDNRGMKLAGKVVGTTAAVMAIAALGAAFSSNTNWGTVLAGSAATGGALGMISAAASRGPESDLPEGTIFTLSTTEP